MKNIFKKIFTFFIFFLFSSYYIVAIALNFPWINEHLKPLDYFSLSKFKKISNNLYLSTYPNFYELKKYKSMGIKEVITLLDPNFPISRELVKEERENCKKLKLKFIVLPISFFSKNMNDYMQIKNILKEDKQTTLINTYFFDSRIKIIEKIFK